MAEFAEGSSLIRVPVSVRDKLATLRRKRDPRYTWSPLETLGQVVKRLADAATPAPKKSSGRKVNNRRGRKAGRRHR